MWLKIYVGPELRSEWEWELELIPFEREEWEWELIPGFGCGIRNGINSN